MRVRVIKSHVPHLGSLGQERTIPDGEARVHIQLGNAEAASAKPAAPRRTYRRRDMTAESPTGGSKKTTKKKAGKKAKKKAAGK